MNSFLDFDVELFRSGEVIVGVDEVGRGPAAGPMVFGLFAFDERLMELEDLNDSKKLTDKKKNALAREFMNGSYKFSVGVV